MQDGVARPAVVTIEVDEGAIEAYPGESLATALLASGRHAFRWTSSGAPRGPFCNMGVCFDCIVQVEGAGRVRACMTPVTPGMVVSTRSAGAATD